MTGLRRGDFRVDPRSSRPQPGSGDSGATLGRGRTTRSGSGDAVDGPADLRDRWLARAIDFVLLFVVSYVVDAFIIVGRLMDADAGLWGIGQDGSYAGVVTPILLAAIYWGYFAVLESQTGWTLGKMLVGVQVRGPAGARPTARAALTCNAFTALGLLGLMPVVGDVLTGVTFVAGVGVIAVTISRSGTRQGWHDVVAGGTRVVKVR
jgi:hypothetical protein